MIELMVALGFWATSTFTPTWALKALDPYVLCSYHCDTACHCGWLYIEALHGAPEGKHRDHLEEWRKCTLYNKKL